MKRKPAVDRKQCLTIRSLTDHLAADRSILANERTMLSYTRTAITLFVTGVTFIRFFDRPVLTVIGVMFIPAALFFLITGVRRYVRCDRFLRYLKEEKDEIEYEVIRESARKHGGEEREAGDR